MLISIIIAMLIVIITSLLTVKASNFPSPYEEKNEVNKTYKTIAVIIMSTFLCVLIDNNIFENWIEATYYSSLFLILYMLAWIDYCFGIIPDKINLPAIVIALVIAIVEWKYNFSALLEVSFAERIIGFVGIILVVWLMSIVLKKEMIGGGDIKLLLWISLAIGYKYMLIGFILACVIGIFIALIKSLVKREFNREMKFGPALALGYIITVLYGDVLFEMYLKLAGFK